MIESDAIEPSPEKIDLIAAALNVSALELVAETNLESAYLASKFTPEEAERIRQARQFTRSQRLVAVQESYRRIAEFFAAFDPSASRAATIDDEVLYQQTVRILRRTIEAAHVSDSELTAGLFVPASMIDEAMAWSPRYYKAMQRSTALIASLVLECPPFDERSSRRDIVSMFGLDRIDEHLERLTATDGAKSGRAS